MKKSDILGRRKHRPFRGVAKDSLKGKKQRTGGNDRGFLYKSSAVSETTKRGGTADASTESVEGWKRRKIRQSQANQKASQRSFT